MALTPSVSQRGSYNNTDQRRRCLSLFALVLTLSAMLFSTTQTVYAIKCYFCDFRVTSGFDDECSTADVNRFESVDCPPGVHTCARYEYASGNKLSIGCGPAGLTKPGQAQTWRGIAHHCTGDLCNGHKTSASSLVKDATSSLADNGSGLLLSGKAGRGPTSPPTFGSRSLLSINNNNDRGLSRLPIITPGRIVANDRGAPNAFAPPSTFQPRPQQITSDLTIERVPVDSGADNFRPAAQQQQQLLQENIVASDNNPYAQNEFNSVGIGSNSAGYNDFGGGGDPTASASRSQGYFPYYRASATTASSASVVTLLLAALSVACAALLAGSSDGGVWPISSMRLKAKEA